MGAILAPHAREKEQLERARQTGSLQRTHEEPRHHDLGPWLMLPWRERAKPLGVGWQRLMLVVVCFVCCVLCFVVVSCVGEQLLGIEPYW